jgi:hypothetical protein
MVEMPRSVSAKKMITSYPVLFGALIALLLCGAIIVIQTWFPWIFEYYDGHRRLVEAVLFTAIYFVVYVYGLRRWRGQAAFWPAISVLFLLHVLGVFFYSTRVGPILLWQWSIVGLVEYYGAAFFLEWSRQRFGHFDTHGSPR